MKSGIYYILQALKSLARTGWMLRGVPKSLAESVAEHSFLSAVVALVMASKLRFSGVDVDPLRATVLALIHDVGEAYIGDIAKVFDELAGAVKESVEIGVVEDMVENEFLKTLYREFHEGKTKEAQIAKLCDHLATYIQARIYEGMGFDVEDVRRSSYERALSIARKLGIEEFFINYVKELEQK